MRIAVIGAGVAGLVAAHRIAAAGHEVDVYERWPGLGGQAATIDVGGGHKLERYYHHLFTTDRHIAALYDELGLEIEWRPSSVAMFARGRQWPFTTPGDLLRFGPLPPLSRVRMGAAVVALQRLANDRAPYERVTARAWIEKWMGKAAYREVWGPMLRGKFGARADEIAMVWLWNKLRLRRGDDAREERLGYPAGSWEPLFEALQARIEGRGGRVLIDRPATRIEPGFEVTYGAPGSFRAGHDPRALRAGRERALRPRARHRPQRRLRPADRPARAADRVLRRALPAARARPAVHPVLLDQRGRPRAAVRRPDRAHELRRARALRRPPLPVRRQLPRARARAARPRRRRAAGALPARPAAREPGASTPPGSATAGSTASRPRSRSSRSGITSASRRSRHPPRASCWPTPPRSIPRTAAPTTPSGSATRRRRWCSQ